MPYTSPPSANARARAIMAANHGLITRPQALDSGHYAGGINHLVRTKVWTAVRRGVYVETELWDSLDERRERHRLRTRAAMATMHRTAVPSHDSAGFELGLEILVPPEPLVHITRPGRPSAWTEAGVKHHYARYHRDQVVRVEDIDVLDLARTAVDIAREHGRPYGEVACDSALRMGVPRHKLVEAYTPMEFWPHVCRVRAAVDFARLGPANVVESLARDLIEEAGLGPTDPQFPVQLSDGRLAWGDVRVGCHFFEPDGKIKYVAVADGGVATQPLTEVIWAEKKRERLLNQEGLGTSRIFYEDYWPPQRERAKRRLREEYAATVARFGTELPERLVRNAAEIRARRGA